MRYLNGYLVNHASFMDKETGIRRTIFTENQNQDHNSGLLTRTLGLLNCFINLTADCITFRKVIYHYVFKIKTKQYRSINYSTQAVDIIVYMVPVTVLSTHVRTKEIKIITVCV